MKIILALLLCSHVASAAYSSNEGEKLNYLLPLAGGIAHPSFNGNTGYDAFGNTNPMGFLYNGGFGLFGLGSAAPGSSQWSYRAGAIYGQKQFGLGIFGTGTPTTSTPAPAGSSNTTTVNWGIGGQITQAFGMGISGNSNLNVISLMFNGDGVHRVGVLVSNLSGGSNAQVYSLGYAYEERIVTFSLGVNYLPSPSSGTALAGLGFHWDKYLVIINYASTFNNSSTPAATTTSSSTGTLTGGFGIQPIKGLSLAATYSTGLMSALIDFTF